MSDFTFKPVGLLVGITPFTDRAVAFCDKRWPKGAPNTCRNTHGGQLLGREDFEEALVAIADAGLEIIAGQSYHRVDRNIARCLHGVDAEFHYRDIRLTAEARAVMGYAA